VTVPRTTRAERSGDRIAAARSGDRIAAARSGDRSSQRRLAYWLIAPAVVLMLAVTAYPIVYAVWLSMHRYNLASPNDIAFIGFANYQTILSDKYWWTAFSSPESSR
jgi:multiple sugar transport system permease protein